ncbi:hypothetical protein [Brevundimonas sp.]|jgi:hypothetical protein|uniref:hypothetical protein n=1 Tax=Brevundimonas sp. TaxID=1871086 RepID=UPI00391C6FFE|nr:hypothetical protein [Brevundimonas sp.]
MNRLTLSAAVLTLAASTALPAFAQERVSFPTRAPDGAERVVMICEQDAATRRAFRREHGQAPAFVTAEQALQARSTGQVWAAPRCMTAREHTRLVSTLTAYAAVR